MMNRELACCTDCLMMVANAENNPEWTEDEIAEYMVRFNYGTQGLHTFPGSLHKNCNHGSDEECPEDEGWFSWVPCDICKRPLGGMRYPIVVQPIKRVIDLKREDAR